MSSDIQSPSEGARISIENGRLQVPDNPVIPYIGGDGIGVDISPVMIDVVDGAVERAYGGAPGKFTGWRSTPERRPTT